MGGGGRTRARSLLGTGDGRALRESDALNDRLHLRLGELEMTELHNSSLRLQVNDLERALDVVRRQADREKLGIERRAEMENSSLRLRLSKLEGRGGHDHEDEAE